MDLLTFRIHAKNSPHAGDIDRLVRVAAFHGCILPPEDAEKAWSDYSSMFAAGWLIMDDHSDFDLWCAIEGRCSRRPLGDD